MRSQLLRRGSNVTAILVFIASGISILFGILNYPVIGHDSYVHLNWLYQFPNILEAGTGYPRWLSDSFGGFGAPTFYFYPPLVYWIASMFRELGITSPAGLYQIIQLTFAILSLLTSYFLIRQLQPTKLPALIGALVYSFLAYRFCDVFIRDALTEHAALAFLPIVFLQFPARIRAIAAWALGWTGLFLTNLPTAYIAVLSVATVFLARSSFKKLWLQGISFLVAIAVSAIYLFPAFALRGLIHQRHLFDLPMHTSQFGFAILDVLLGHFDWLRILSVATIIAAILVLIYLLKRDGVRGWSSAGWEWLIAVAIFFQIPFISTPFWHLIPGMPFVQFSWRWNGVLLLAIVLVGSGGAISSRIFNCILIGLAIVTMVSEFTISRNLFVRPPLAINSYLLDAPEYATKWASSDPSEVIGVTLRRREEPAAVLLGLTLPGDSIALRSKTPREWKFEANLARPTPVRFHQFYWPYWRPFADTTELAMRPDPNGFATTQLPAGHTIITLKLVTTSIERRGGYASLLGLAALTLLLVLAGYRWIIIRRETTSLPELTRSV